MKKVLIVLLSLLPFNAVLVGGNVSVIELSGDYSPDFWGGDTWLVGGTGSGSLIIGEIGLGTMTIGEGGRVEDSFGKIGGMPGSAGAVTVSGGQWSNNVLIVGDEGSGELTVENGGHVTGTLRVGRQGDGTVLVTGAGSHLEAGLINHVGMNSTGILSIREGALVTSDHVFVIAGIGESGSGSVTVSGAGSRLQTGHIIDVGHVADGLLNVSDGGLVSTDLLTISIGGRLSGDGTVQAITTRIAGGVLAPGNSIGTLTIDGDVLFDTASVFEVEIDNAGQSDKLDVTGDVLILAGSTISLNSNGETITHTKNYELITAAGGISGQFDTVNTALLNLEALVDPAIDMGLDYDPHKLVLRIDPLRFDNPSLAVTATQRSLGSVLQRASTDGDLNAITSGLQSIGTAAQLRAAYDQLAGQGKPSLAPVASTGSSRFINTVSGRMQSVRTVTRLWDTGYFFAQADLRESAGGFSDAAARATDGIAIGHGTGCYSDSPYGFWMKGFGAVGDRETDDAFNGYGYRTAGLSTGFDYAFTEHFLGGVTVGYSDTEVHYADSPDSSGIDSTYAGLYGSYTTYEGYIDGVFTYADLSLATDRTVGFLNERLEANFDGYQLTSYLEAGRNYYCDTVLVQPLVGFEYGYQKQEAYREMGGSSALGYDAQRTESYKLSLGAKVSRFLFNDFETSLWMQLRAKWVHEFGDTGASVTSRFASAPGQSFVVEDAGLNRDSAVVGTGLIFEPKKNVELFVDYDALLSSDTVAHIFSGGLKLNW